jgi:hypothetical protein
VLNWSVDFGPARWDLMPVLPSVARTLTDEERKRQELARRIITGMDTRCVDRPEGDERPPDEIISDRIAEQSQPLAVCLSLGRGGIVAGLTVLHNGNIQKAET